MTDSAVHIALAANHRYSPGLKATVVSLLNAAGDPSRLRFHVFSDGLTEADRNELAALARRFGSNGAFDFRTPDMADISARFQAYYGTHTTFIRLYFPVLLPELDWVLWADVDTLWFKDPALLWAERDDAVSLVWVEDLPSTKRSVGRWHTRIDPDFARSPYGCAGVMLMNLRKLRETQFVARGFALVERFGTPPFADQGVFNALCADDAKIVDATWNLLNPTTRIASGVVLHFNGLGKRFNDPAFAGWRPLYEIWFRYRAQVVEGRVAEEVCPVAKRFVFGALALLYPIAPLLCALPMRYWHRDNLRRTLFFAWLGRRRLWTNPKGGRETVPTVAR